MSTRSCVIIKVRPADIGKVMKFNKESLPVEDRDWDGEIGEDKTEEVEIKCAYLSIYCHCDGCPNGVGAALKANFKTYEQVLNLILGGDCSIIGKEYIKRYSTREGEDWCKPYGDNDLEEVVSKYDWSEYAYQFTEEKGWMVKDIYEGGGFRSF